MKEDHNNVIKEEIQCLCQGQKACTDCPLGFEKILALENAGLVIYRHLSDPEIVPSPVPSILRKGNLCLAALGYQEPMMAMKHNIRLTNMNKNIGAGGRDLQAEDHRFLFHNTKDADIVSMDILPEMEKMALKCDRCRKILQNAITLLQTVRAISRKEVVGICDHCKLIERPCCKCDCALKKFFGIRKAKEFSFDKERTREWLAKVQTAFKDIDKKDIRRIRLKDYIKKYEGDEKPLRAYSDEHIDQLYRQKHKRNERELKIRDLCRPSDEHDLSRPITITTDKSKKHIYLNLDVLDTEPGVTDQQSIISLVSFDRKSKSASLKLKPSHEYVRDGDEILDTNKIDGTISTDRKMKLSHKLAEDEKLTTPKTEGDSKIEAKSIDDTHPPLPATPGRDSYWDIIIPPTQYKHDAEKQKLHREKTIDKLVSNFSLIFPSKKPKLGEIVSTKSSSELISEVRDRIRGINEENKRKNEDDRMKKLEEKQEKKQRAQQEKLKLEEEKQRLLEEKKLIDRKLGIDTSLTDKNKMSFKDETFDTSETTLKAKKSKSESDQKGISTKSGLKESKMQMDKLKSETKLRSKFDSKQSKTDSKQYEDESKTGLKAGSKTGFKAGSKTGFKAGSKTGFKAGSKTGLKDGSKQSKANLKQAKDHGEADSKKYENESKTGSKAVTRSGPSAGSKQFKENVKQAKGDPTVATATATAADVAVPTIARAKADSKQSKYEPNESKVASKQLTDDALQPTAISKSEGKGESKESKTYPEQVKSEAKDYKAGVKELTADSKDSKAQTLKTKLKDDKLKSDSKFVGTKGTKDSDKAGKNTDQLDFEKGEKQKNKAGKYEDNVNKEKDLSKDVKATTTEKSKIEEMFNKPKNKDATSGNEPRIPRRQLDAQAKAQEIGMNAKKTKQELKVDRIKMLQSSNKDFLDLVKLEQTLPINIALPEINLNDIDYKSLKPSECPMCIKSDLDLEHVCKKKTEIEPQEMIHGRIIRSVPAHIEEKEDICVKPAVYQLKYDDKFVAEIIEPPKHIPVVREYSDEKESKKTLPVEETKGVISYALSDRTFIEKGWTMLPTEKVVRKMNVYRMRPAKPEFDWFEHNKNKRFMTYDTGERLAEFDDDGHGRFFYRNQRLALQYYDAEELNAQQRFVIYSNGEPDERGRTRPYTILATFDYLGNGIVFDHSGKIRMKYNQTEGIILDKSLGPVSHWKWHTLNDPPVLQQVMIDTHMSYKDPEILKMPTPHDKNPRPDNEDMLAIEFDNFIKEKSKKLKRTFKPFQIKMKALKINENFSLKVLDQATVYLIYRDGTTNIKLNLGMLLDHKEIVDTDTAEVGEVASNVERLPARTDSLAAMQKSVAFAQHFERTRTERERRLRPTEPIASADKLTAAASRPMRPPLRAACSSTATSTYCPRSRKPSSNALYYDNRLC